MSQVPAEVLGAWGWDGDVVAEPCSSGLINSSWNLLDAAGAPIAVLQRLNTSIFKPVVHEDTAVVTGALRAAGLVAPELLRTRAGGLWLETGAGEVWRAMTVVGAATFDTVDNLERARSAGALVARFHGALASLPYRFQHVRAGAHDTDRHMRTLREAIDANPGHRLIEEVRTLAEGLFASWAELRDRALVALPERVIHGDLKISNVRFGGPGDDQAVALIDLDTLAWGTLDIELGDALRSWCATAPEDDVGVRFNVDTFAAAMEGYASARGAWGPTPAEWASIVPGVQRIATELSARFAADALVESYFGWDRARFPLRGEHNLLRARGQAALANAVAVAHDEAQARLNAILEG